MTREQHLISMTGAMLIAEADKLRIKVSCNKARTSLKEAKAKVIERILEAEAETEVAPEAPKTQNKEVSEKPKQNAKPKAKKSNLKLTELTYKGETKSIRAWAEELDMPWPTLYDRVNRNGWSTEDAIETPLGQRRAK